uniref:Uncharacterized protein n=1 Tax=Rhizophora mucronata TaxID=61149 RepID=A0A2P2M6B2_RHIMU
MCKSDDNFKVYGLGCCSVGLVLRSNEILKRILA